LNCSIQTCFEYCRGEEKYTPLKKQEKEGKYKESKNIIGLVEGVSDPVS